MRELCFFVWRSTPNRLKQTSAREWVHSLVDVLFKTRLVGLTDADGAMGNVFMATHGAGFVEFQTMLTDARTCVASCVVLRALYVKIVDCKDKRQLVRDTKKKVVGSACDSGSPRALVAIAGCSTVRLRSPLFLLALSVTAVA